MFSDQSDQQPFATVLAQLFNDETISIPLLFRLSDMMPDERVQFETHWAAATDERRSLLVQHLADLAEINFEVEFSPLFAIGLTDTVAAVRLAALDGLWDSEDVKLIRPIIALMQNDVEVMVRVAAARTLAHYVLLGAWGQVSADSTAIIVDALLAQHQSAETIHAVRCAALESLGAADHHLVPGLIEAAYDSGDPELQSSALFAMGSSADSRWVGILIDEMESPYVEMRLQAVRAAGEIGDSDTVDGLSEAIFDEDDEVSAEAILALGKTGNSRAIQILTRLAEDPELAYLHELIDEALDLSADSDFDSFDFDFGFDFDDEDYPEA
ncbi:MAG: HEAT repeat domain-containing protein [Anaerolineae bacterium]|nr:HEAT repeat domain-containing protein [Anaerolineae bacterium]MCO5188789.1 HEAT repeat domain-containing protein [Anaerolineae bacterium]MCO5191859.1 HEAT repeat domain-containing protein [Anaerolineae bacterium]MCO5197675.1 HEAT repeat domain-containing protein [Anaerolineae bacterium]MCO5206602.1 HEAT repeat domain-containing protein [Anaerolineae bacterium]